MSPPLDLAAQLALINWTAQSSPLDQIAIERIIIQLAALGGIQNLSSLYVRRSRGLSVRDQIPSYPRGDRQLKAELIRQIDQVLQNLQPIPVPVGAPVPYNAAEWSHVTAVAADLDLQSTAYVGPLEMSAPPAEARGLRASPSGS